MNLKLGCRVIVLSTRMAKKVLVGDRAVAGLVFFERRIAFWESIEIVVAICILGSAFSR